MDDTYQPSPRHVIQDTLGALSDTAEVLDITRARRDELILECVALGLGYRAIARRAGISHQRVAQIVQAAS